MIVLGRALLVCFGLAACGVDHYVLERASVGPDTTAPDDAIGSSTAYLPTGGPGTTTVSTEVFLTGDPTCGGYCTDGRCDPADPFDLDCDDDYCNPDDPFDLDCDDGWCSQSDPNDPDCHDGDCNPDNPGDGDCDDGLCDPEHNPADLDCHDGQCDGDARDPDCVCPPEEPGCSNGVCNPTAPGDPDCTPCLGDQECSGGDVCFNGVCICPAPDQPDCGFDGLCDPGAIFDPDCSDGVCDPMILDFDCADGLCDPSDSNDPDC